MLMTLQWLWAWSLQWHKCICNGNIGLDQNKKVRGVQDVTRSKQNFLTWRPYSWSNSPPHILPPPAGPRDGPCDVQFDTEEQIPFKNIPFCTPGGVKPTARGPKPAHWEVHSGPLLKAEKKTTITFVMFCKMKLLDPPRPRPPLTLFLDNSGLNLIPGWGSQDGGGQVRRSPLWRRSPW